MKGKRITRKKNEMKKKSARKKTTRKQKPSSVPHVQITQKSISSSHADEYERKKDVFTERML